MSATLFPLSIEPGTLVGGQRWPRDASHPDGWLQPWCGAALAQNDPRAWEGSIAFPPGLPSQQAVDAHVTWCHSQNLLRGNSTPVLWDFGDCHKVYWEDSKRVVPYSEDVAAWKAAREAAYRDEEKRAAAYRAANERPSLRVFVA